MAAGMFGSSNPLMSGGGGQARPSDPLDEVITENVGFVSLNGDARPLRILPTQWPTDALPPPTASLFSVASRNGLLAAADPNKLVIAQTKDVRTDLARTDGQEETVKTLSRSMTIDLPTRVCQVAFSSDEKYLVISAESGGGLQVYETASIKQNNTQHAFQIGTNDISVRALIANPAEDQGHLFAVVLSDGKLVIANMKDRNLQNSSQGSPLLRDGGVSCCSWSAKGKHIVAGLEDGTAVHLTPDGTVKATIPKPPPTNDPKYDNCHVASMLWLDNTSFFIIYNSNVDAMDLRTFIVTKQENTFSFRKLANEPLAPFGQLRQPPHYFISRLRAYEPNLKDALFVTTTCGPDVGLIANSATPLSRDAPNTANNYAPVTLSEDSRRAQLNGSVGDDMAMEDPSALGMAFDFSPDERVKRPIPQQTDALEQAPHSVPAIMVLNHEGILSAWWFIYNEAILQNKIYRGMNEAPAAPAQPTTPATPAPSQPAFGQSGFSAFKTPTAAPAQSLGGGASPWGSQQKGPAFGQSGFGAPAFGAPSQPAFGAQSTPAQPAFGSASALGGANKVFGGNSTSNASPFGKVTSQGNDAGKASPFGAFAVNKDTGSSSPFGNINKNAETTSLFGKKSPETASFGNSTFGQASNQQTGWGFGQPEKKDEKPLAFNQQPSSGSTMTIGSSFGTGSFGKPSGLGSDASPWATPSLSNNTSGSLKPATNKAQGEDADMDMDKKADNVFGSGISELGFGEKKDEPSKAPESPAETPKIKEEPVDDAPLPPDFSTKPSEPNVSEPSADIPPPTPSPAALPPSPKADKEVPQAAKTPEKPALKHSDNDESTTPKTAEQTPTKDRDDGRDDRSEPSPAGSEPEIVEAERSMPPSPTRSIVTEADPTIDLNKAGTWPRQKSPVQPTPQKPSMFGGDSGTPTGSISFGQTPTTNMTKPPVFFKPPGGESPRSPSPVRQQPPGGRRIASPTRRSSASPIRLAAPSPDRAASSPVPTTFAPTPRKPTSNLANQITPARDSPTPTATPATRTPAPAPRVPSVDFSAAQETEDRMQEDLERPLKASKKLKDFIAHTDYVDSVGGTSIASQVERLYRDGNSMVDTLGMNAKTLGEFIKGHEELYKQREHDVEDLEPERQDSWTLTEIDDLGILQKDLASNLDADRPQNVRDTLLELRDIHRETVSIRNKRQEVAHAVSEIQSLLNGEDPFSQSGRAKPKLSTQQSAVLRDLRKQYSKVQTLVAQAEEATSLLRAKVVAQEAKNGGMERGEAREVPTVEAVVNTIAKMTRMAEMKRGDVDLLEARLKKMRRGSKISEDDLGKSLSRISLGDGGRRSVRASETPSPRKSIRGADRRPRGTKSSSYALTYSDEEDDEADGVMVKRENNAEDEDLARSTRALAIRGGSTNGGGRTNLSGLSPAELEGFIDKQENRRQVLGMFRDQIVARGPKVRNATKA